MRKKHAIAIAGNAIVFELLSRVKPYTGVRGRNLWFDKDNKASTWPNYCKSYVVLRVIVSVGGPDRRGIRFLGISRNRCLGSQDTVYCVPGIVPRVVDRRKKSQSLAWQTLLEQYRASAV